MRPERPGQDSTGIVWFRRDLRLDDNPAWATATTQHRDVVALFVLEPTLLARAGRPRRNQLIANLRALDGELRDRGGALTVRSGPAPEAVSSIASESGAASVHVNADVSPFGLDREAGVEERLLVQMVPLVRHDGNLVHPPGSVLTRAGTLSKVFTPFHRAWSRTALPTWPEPGPGVAQRMSGAPLPTIEDPPPLTPGSQAAWARLEHWLDRVDDYPRTRDVPGIDGTSGLSTDLKFGTIAARAVVDVVGSETAGRAAFVRQLAWRDWWAHTLAERPDLLTGAIRPRFDDIAWLDDPEGFDAWAGGVTGYPIVDAGMRQLAETGWIHNRVRMICASFLVKDLLIDWRRGERLFRHHLIDGDPAQNAGNWQWVAGTGPDAAPYFRVFNPTSQSRRFDADGSFIRRWVPELRSLDDATIHEPATAGPLALGAAGVELGVDYPLPIVDHDDARRRAIDAYATVSGIPSSGPRTRR